jgi:microcystin-dependent protein
VSSYSGEHGESQDLKLTESEIKLVAKLLSDPTYFPVEFRTWLKNYIEGAGIQINASQIRGGAGGSVNLPPGIILPYAGGTIASNVLPCDGQAVSRSFYDGLYEAIGTVWGAGDGTTTFNMPDLRDRALFGAGSVVGLAGNDGRPLGSRGGPSHHHYFTDTASFGTSYGGDHSHSYDRAYGVSIPIQNAADSPANVVGVTGGTTGGGGGHDHGGTVNVNGNTSGGYDQDKVSYAGIKYVITTGKGG